MIIDDTDYIMHYGIIRRSGRYPWGSSGWGKGEEAVIGRNQSFLDYISNLLRLGWTEKKIADGFGISINQLRAEKTLAINEQKQARIAMAQRLKDKGYSNVAIGERMGLNESSVRALLAPGAKDKADVIISTANMLKEELKSKPYLDVGVGTEKHIGISEQKLKVALTALQEEGYEVHTVKVRQLGTGLDTEVKVLVAPGVTQKEVWQNKEHIQLIGKITEDGGRSYSKDHTPLSVNPDRLMVAYAEDGGAERDGVIFLRPGVEDLSMGNSRYAQVRIKVGDDRYLKGMAMYKDDMPPGVDIIFNTNKSATGNKLDALKEINKENPDYPFGAVTRPILENIGTDSERVKSAVNLIYEEGDWQNWSNSLSTQMLSKQNLPLIKRQLDLTYSRREADFESISNLTNPTIKKKLLETFADEVDSDSVHLAAAALPRQNWSVILPINTLKDNEIYAPNYKDGEKVVLIRYPHGGIFEIPELTVNNKNREGKKYITPDSMDAVGINHRVAERLSGADFDGDTVLVIPDNKNRIKTSPPLEGLKRFDPQTSYPGYPGMKTMTSAQKGLQMGQVSNLITDMTIKGAPHSDIARAVRHSMVVIDAEKHGLNWKQSELDNGISQLKEKYQGGKKAGASTLISKATSPLVIDERKPRPYKDGGPIDTKTGELIFVPTGRTRTRPDGSKTPVQQRTTKLAATTDARKLSSGTPVEEVYASHSNSLKTLANKARLEAHNTPNLSYSPSARRAYPNEVASLDSKLTLAQQNAPLERQAQVIANSIVRAKKESNPDLSASALRTLEAQALGEARNRIGAKKYRIDISPTEWNAIQAGAISNNKLSQILNNTDIETVKKYATPKREVLMDASNTSLAKSLLDSGYTRSEVAERLGVSVSTLDRATV